MAPNTQGSQQAANHARENMYERCSEVERKCENDYQPTSPIHTRKSSPCRSDPPSISLESSGLFGGKGQYGTGCPTAVLQSEGVMFQGSSPLQRGANSAEFSGMDHQLRDLKDNKMVPTSANTARLHGRENLQKQVGELNTQIQYLQNSFTDKQNRIDDLEREVKGKESQIQQLTGDLQQRNKQLQEQKRKIDTLEDIARGKDKNIHDLTNRQVSVTETAKLEEQIKTLNDEIQRLTAKSRTLQEEKATLEKEFGSVKKRLTDEQNRINDLENELKGQESQIQQLTSNLQQRNNQLQEQKRTSDTLEELARRKDKDIHDLTNRLSAEFGTKVSADESSLENVSIRDRPMNIASDYALLCSDQWLTAKTELDKLLPDTKEENETKLKFLCHILVIGLSEGEKLRKGMLNAISKILQMPGQAASDANIFKGPDLPEKLMQNLMDLERQTVTATDLSVLCQNIRKEVTIKANTTFTNAKTVMLCQGLLTYIDAVTIVTWKMVLQRPMMSFRQDGIGGKWQGDTKQEVFYTSSDPKDPASRVKYHVHPALYHGESMMVKGRVILSKD